MNRRIKRRFDEEGLGIPFPHRTLFLGDSARTFSLTLDDTARTELGQIIREERPSAHDLGRVEGEQYRNPVPAARCENCESD
jgi:hypothetical protein